MATKITALGSQGSPSAVRPSSLHVPVSAPVRLARTALTPGTDSTQLQGARLKTPANGVTTLVSLPAFNVSHSKEHIAFISNVT